MLRRLRRARLILLALLLAPLTTVLVAWSCAFFLQLQGGAEVRVEVVATPSSVHNVEWRYGVWSRPGATRVRVTPVRHEGVKMEDVTGIPELTDVPPASVPVFRAGWPGARMERLEGWTEALPRVQDARGWPWLAMSSEHFLHSEWDENAAVSEWHVRAYRGLVADVPNAGDITPEPVILPLGILWRGFWNCTLLYAALWLVLLYSLPIVFAMRARARRWRGRCPVCAYPLRGGSSCPECGWGTAA